MSTYDWALDILATTPTLLGAALGPVPAGVFEARPSPDAWSIQQVLGHLLQAESAVIAARTSGPLRRLRSPRSRRPVSRRGVPRVRIV
ncbi:MAG TPA: hypothetical protein VMW65_02045 [Chloroflexota bacterium]|nr:hypothetical protein [Chloroflexota bacterium]